MRSAAPLALLVLLLACGSSCSKGEPQTCRIEAYAAADELGDTPDACGSFSLDPDGGYDDADMLAAHNCVLAAVAGQRPFTLFYDVWDPYQHIRGGFVGALDKDILHIKAYAYVGDTLGGSFDPRPSVTVETCATIVDAGCIPSAGKPCLTCQTPGPESVLCRY